MEKGKLVSVIMPAFNCENYIGETINSVVKQTYPFWELIIVDDCSTDQTFQIASSYAKTEKRIKIFRLESNSGAAVARNRAIELAKGKYLAFLDSDDLWKKEKLEKQISFMEKNAYDFSCTAYGKVDEESNIMERVVHCRDKYDYPLILKECFGNSTVIYDAEHLGKIYGENIRKRNDFVMWLKVIKQADWAYGLDEVLGYHRVRSGSISYNKAELMKYQWQVYRKIEKLSLYKSCSLILVKVLQAVRQKGL